MWSGPNFYGKQSPAVRHLNLNGMVLQSLAIAYELTGTGNISMRAWDVQWISGENLPPCMIFKIKRMIYRYIQLSGGAKALRPITDSFLHFIVCNGVGILEPDLTKASVGDRSGSAFNPSNFTMVSHPFLLDLT